jgi:hypothetical protein
VTKLWDAQGTRRWKREIVEFAVHLCLLGAFKEWRRGGHRDIWLEVSL